MFASPVHDVGSRGRPGKRKRAAYSCTECTKGKAKCDREQPCQRCVTRRIPHLCHYLVSGCEDPIEVSKDIRDRLTRIETLLLQRELGLPAVSIPQSPPAEESTTQPLPEKRGFITSGRYYGPSAMSNVGNGSASDIMRALNVPDPTTPTTALLPTDRRPPRALVDLLHELPPQSRCDDLIKLYMDNINPTRYPIRPDLFWQFYGAIWDSMTSFSVEARNIHKLPLLFIILAISTLSAPREVLGFDAALSAAADAEKRLSEAEKLFQASRRASAFSDGTLSDRGDLMLVMADVLTVRYLILVRRAPDSLSHLGSAVFRAQALGLHRNPSIMGPMDISGAQERRMIWSYVFHLDRYCALLLGRPLGIMIQSCDTSPPLHLGADETVMPASCITDYSFFVLRHSLSILMGRIAGEVFALQETSYDRVLELEDALQKWLESVPPDLVPTQYGQQPADGNLNKTIRVQKHYLSTEFNFVRISLHRPYLARPDPENRYGVSRMACLHAAANDLWSRTVFVPPGSESLSMGSYRVTNSIIILGISMLLNPSSESLKMIQDCLSQFSVARQGSNGLLDDIKIRQVATIELLQLRAGRSLTRIQSRAGSPAPNTDTGLESAGLNLVTQEFLDSFWPAQGMPDLYGHSGAIGDEMGLVGESDWDNLDAMLGAWPGNMEPFQNGT